MKVQIISDLHLEFGRKIMDFINPVGEVLVIAGDLAVGKELEYALLNIADKVKIPVIYVPGNHEFYHGSYEVLTRWLNNKKKDFKKKNVHVLTCNTLEIDGVTFIGAIGWTDGSLIKNNPLHQFKLGFSDFRTISDFVKNDGGQIWGRKDIKFIVSKLLTTSNKTVVITHHAPSYQSCAPSFYHSELNAFFLNNWDSIIEQYQPKLWIHGHVHNSNDYHIGDTRIVCNPYGYQGRDVNVKFNPLFTCEV